MFFHIQSYRLNMRYIAIIILLLTALLISNSAAFAQGNLAVSLFPALSSISSKDHYFVYNSSSGTVIEDSVRLINSSDEPLDLHLYAADAVTASEGGAAFSTNLGETPTREGAWLSLSESRVTLQPKEERVIPFALNIPADAIVGEHAAFIVTQRADRAENQQNSSGVGIELVPRVAVAVWTTIPGGTDAQMEISTLTAGESSKRHIVVANLHNTGNVGFKAEGTLTIREPQTGNIVYDAPLRLGYFLAGSSLEYYINLGKELPTGDYEAHLSLRYEDKTAEWTQLLTLPELKPIGTLPTTDENGNIMGVLPQQEVVTNVAETTSAPTVEPTIPIEWLIAGAATIVSVLLLLIFFVWAQLRRAARMQQANF